MPLIPKQQPSYYQTSPTNQIKQYLSVNTQTGANAPTPHTIINTLGTITWARTGQGTYTGTLTNAFKENKTWLSITPNGSGGSFLALIRRLNDNTIEYLVLTLAGAGADDATVFINILTTE